MRVRSLQYRSLSMNTCLPQWAWGLTILTVKNPSKSRTFILKVASANGQDSVVSLLISRGANIEHADSSGWTALHQVLEIVPLLLMFYINMWAGKCFVFRVVSTDTRQQWCCFLLQERAWSPRISRSSKISVIPSLLLLQMVNLVEMSTWSNGHVNVCL